MSAIAQATQVRPTSKNRVAFGVQVVGAVLLVAAIIVGVFASHANASPLSNSTVTLKVSSSGAVAASPLTSNATVDVAVAPNSTLSRSALETAGFQSGAVTIKFLECSDPGGSAANLPKKPGDCEPESIDSVAGAQENGSLEMKGYTVYALPDPADLGASNGTLCDAEHVCVVGIFSNQNDFSKPHLFSAPFNVAAAAASAGATASTSATTSGPTNSGASAAVSVTPATLANTGGPTLWPWLLALGGAMLLIGSALRYRHRTT